jgi:RNA-directed DNA polymerase
VNTSQKRIFDETKPPGLEAVRGVQDLAFVCKCKPELLEHLLRDPSQHYRHWHKKKKSGKLRKISAPDYKLKSIQRSLALFLSETCKLPEFVHGGVRGRSPATNAGPHVGHKNLLNIDIQDFFPSTSQQMVMETLERLGAVQEVAKAVCRLATLDGGLPQGAPTSTILSNLVFGPADVRLSGLCRKHGLEYSRFADDIAISGDSDLKPLIGPITAIIRETGYIVAKEKTSLTSTDRPQIITGIQVNDGVGLPTSWKKDLRELILECHSLGPTAVARRDQRTIEKLRQHVYGKINFLRSIDPSTGRKMRRLACNIDWQLGKPTPIGFRRG